MKLQLKIYSSVEFTVKLLEEAHKPRRQPHFSIHHLEIESVCCDSAQSYEEKETNSGDKRPEDASVSGKRTEDAIKRRFWIDRDGSGAEYTLNVQPGSFSVASRVSLSRKFKVNILKVTKNPKDNVN